MRVSTSEAPTDISDNLTLIRSLELELERLEHGLAMPRDKDAIARTKVLLKKAEHACRQALTG
jgi:hypothetical protein